MRVQYASVIGVHTYLFLVNILGSLRKLDAFLLHMLIPILNRHGFASLDAAGSIVYSGDGVRV